MKNVAITLSSLVKNNNGLFKSEKQAAFILKVVGTTYVQNMAISLGEEYNGKRVGKDAQRVYTIDQQGICKVVHVNSKGEEVIFDRAKGINIPAQQMSYVKAALQESERQIKAYDDEQEAKKAVFIEEAINDAKASGTYDSPRFQRMLKMLMDTPATNGGWD